MIKVKVQADQAYDYVEVREIVQWDGQYVKRTKHKGYAHKDRQKQSDEMYMPIIPLLGSNPFVELELME